MYNYIFYVVYDGNRSRNKSVSLSRWNASIVVFFAAFIHILLLLSICRRYNIATVSLVFLTDNSIVGMVFILLLMYLIYRYYTEERVKKLSEKYAKRSLSGLMDVLLIAALLIIPMVAVIILRWKG